MFDTVDEAVEMNSQCTFCNKTKFVVVQQPDNGPVSLERCISSDCEQHCGWGHEPKINMDFNVDHHDVMNIIRGN